MTFLFILFCFRKSASCTHVSALLHGLIEITPGSLGRGVGTCHIATLPVEDSTEAQGQYSDSNENSI